MKINGQMSDATIAANNAIDTLHKDIDEHWNSTGYTKSIVAIIDIMGIKELFLGSSSDFTTHSLIYKSWDKILKTQMLKEYQADLSEKYGEFNLKSTLLSDSIVLSMDVNTPNAFSKMFMMIGLFCHSLFLLSTPYFTRGAIVIGDIYHENNIVFGPALVKAHLLESNKAVNFRYIIDKDDFLKASVYMEDDFKSILEAFFYQDDEFYCLDYLYRFLYYAENRVQRNQDTPTIYTNALNRLFSKIKYEIENNETQRVIDKYRWMKSYFHKTITKTLEESDGDDFVWLREALKKKH